MSIVSQTLADGGGSSSRLSVPLALIDSGENVRELDDAHVDALAGSIALRGLIVPLLVRVNGGRYVLVAGEHRLAACRKLGVEEVEVTLRPQESSADAAAENILRKQLSPLEEARAVARMFDDGLTPDGAASALGWSRARVTARAKILELSEIAQELLGDGRLPVGAVDPLLAIAKVSPELAELAVQPIANGGFDGAQLVRNPGWVLRIGLDEGTGKTFAANLKSVNSHVVRALRLGRKVEALYAEAERLHQELDRDAYGPPAIRFVESDVDQARAAGVLIEFENDTPIITDRPLYRELVKQAIRRMVDELRARKVERDAQRVERGRGTRERTPREQVDVEHRAALRELTARAHGVNLELGAALLNGLSVVDPTDMNVARFFAYGLLGPDLSCYLGTDETVRTIATNGIRLVIGEHRTADTPILKSGKRGKTKVVYGEPEESAKWLWSFVDRAKTAGELYGRVMVVCAAQHYAHQLVLPQSKRKCSALPRSRKDAARKAFERVVKDVLPESHKQLQRALEREARSYRKRVDNLNAAAGHEHGQAESGHGGEIDEERTNS